MFRQTLMVGIIAACLPPFPAQATPAKNVLLILTDDMNDAVGRYGSNVAKTPNIDKLAARGVLFSIAQSNEPLCNPSRASFLSGTYPETTGVYFNDRPEDNPRIRLGPDWVMLPEHFDKQGYFTARIGKIAHDTWAAQYHWDLDMANATGPNPPYETVFSGGVGRWKWAATTQLDENTTDGRNVRYVARLIEEHKDGPFFIAMGFRKPHTPWICPKKYYDQYSTSMIKLPLESGEPADDRQDIPKEALTTGTEWRDLGTDTARRQAILAAYACHSFVDAGVGVLMDTLTRLGLWQNTVVVFASDNGYHYGEHGGLVAKMTLFAESTRIPLIIAAPGMIAGKTSYQPAELVDLYPTLNELTGLPAPIAPTILEGKSLVPQLLNPATPSRPAYSLTKLGVFGRSVRSCRYRYTEWSTNPVKGELYDLKTDPGEYVNQIANPAYATILSDIKRKLESAKKRPFLLPSSGLSGSPSDPAVSNQRSGVLCQ